MKEKTYTHSNIHQTIQIHTIVSYAPYTHWLVVAQVKGRKTKRRTKYYLQRLYVHVFRQQNNSIKYQNIRSHKRLYSVTNKSFWHSVNWAHTTSLHFHSISNSIHLQSSFLLSTPDDLFVFVRVFVFIRLCTNIASRSVFYCVCDEE